MPACAAAVHMLGPFCTAIALLTARTPMPCSPTLPRQLTAKSKPWTLLEKGRCPRGALALVGACVPVATAPLAGQEAWPALATCCCRPATCSIRAATSLPACLSTSRWPREGIHSLRSRGQPTGRVHCSAASLIGVAAGWREGSQLPEQEQQKARHQSKAAGGKGKAAEWGLEARHACRWAGAV